jgi:hypothetical protein
MKYFDKQIGKKKNLYSAYQRPDGSYELALGKHLWNIIPTNNGSFNIEYRGKHDYQIHSIPFAKVKVVEHCHRDVYQIDLIDDDSWVWLRFGETIGELPHFYFYYECNHKVLE